MAGVIAVRFLLDRELVMLGLHGCPAIYSKELWDAYSAENYALTSIIQHSLDV